MMNDHYREGEDDCIVRTVFPGEKELIKHCHYLTISLTYMAMQ